MRQRLAAGALVVENDRLLLVHHVRPAVYDFWVPPGGGVRGKEELPSGAVRETAEETGLIVEPTRLAYVDELIISGVRQCKLWYLARRVSEELSSPRRPRRARKTSSKRPSYRRTTWKERWSFRRW